MITKFCVINNKTVPTTSSMTTTVFALTAFAIYSIVSFLSIIFFLLAVVSIPAGFLMVVIDNMTKLFYIRKSVTGIDPTTALLYSKKTLYISKIPFISLDNAWQYILKISNE